MPGIREFTHEELPFLSTALLTKKVTLDSTALDAGNTGQTHILRASLGLARDTVAGAYVHYQPAGSNGTDTADCVLMEDVDLKGGDPGAASADRKGLVLILGSVVAGKVLLQDANMITDLNKAGGGEGWIEFV